MKKIITFPLIILFTLLNHQLSAFDVKGVAISTALCSNGKCEVNPNNDEVIYEVNKQDGKII